jgi:hypothetical protein
MSLIKDDLVPDESIIFEKVVIFKPDYEYIKCRCGGIIGSYDRGDRYICEKCRKDYAIFKLDYDRKIMNDKTGWIFPVKDKHKE